MLKLKIKPTQFNIKIFQWMKDPNWKILSAPGGKIEISQIEFIILNV